MSTPVQEHKLDLRLRRLYGITLARYKEMLALNRGRCWICNRPPKQRRLNVDHDHKTEAVRGLLCFQCNRRLVGRRRDPELFEKAAYYLRLGIDFRASDAMTQVSEYARSAAGDSGQLKSSAVVPRRSYVQPNVR